MERNEDKGDSHLLPLARLPGNEPVDFSLIPGKETRDALAGQLELLGLAKLRFQGKVVPEGKGDWRLLAHLGATVVQPCVVTLQPVTTRLEEDVTRLYLRDMVLPDAGEVEMPEDDTAEPLPPSLDLAQVMAEALALALPPYPRAPDAALDEAQFTEPGKAPLRDEDLKPFAGLEALKQRLEDKE